MAKNVYENRKDDLNYKDSWLNTSVELAALGTILAGAGTLAIKGDFADGVRSGKQAIGAMGKGFENYINRRGSVGSKFGLQVGKRTFDNLKRMPSLAEGADELPLLVRRTREKMEADPRVQEKIRGIVSKKINRNVVDDVLDGTEKASDKNMKDQVNQLYESALSKEMQKELGMVSKDTFQSQNRSGKKPLITRDEVLRNMATSGLAGLAFGGGISGFHAVDRLTSNPDVQKTLEDSFHFGGSYLPRKDDNRMKKTAGSLEVYNKLKNLGNKTPEAVATGLGFTGVSLGAASMMNKSEEKKKKENPEDKNTRVIIELGNQEQSNNQNMAQHPSLAGLPKLSALKSGEALDKKANIMGQKWLSSFVNDLKGHGKKIDELKAINPSDKAAEQLRGANVDDMVKNQYGNLVNDKTQANFTNELYKRTTENAKSDIDDQIRSLATRTADARLKAGGGLLGVGGIAAASQGRKPQEDVQ